MYHRQFYKYVLIKRAGGLVLTGDLPQSESLEFDL